MRKILQLLTSFMMWSDFFSAWLADIQTETDLPNATENSAGLYSRPARERPWRLADSNDRK